jgi:hypothetical protein
MQAANFWNWTAPGPWKVLFRAGEEPAEAFAM